MDNRIFNVNGSGEEMLLAALRLAFLQEGENTSAEAWSETNEHGLILYWSHSGGAHLLPSLMTAEECLPFVSAWLRKGHPDIKLDDWDRDLNHDGSNSRGWRVYCEDWGKVNGSSYSICAIKPVFLWHGK